MYTPKNVIQNETGEMRAKFAEVMTDFANTDPDVVYLDCDVINSIGMAGFSREFPERTVNCGIQEANMIGVAAGMSAVGLKPFTHTFGPFAVRRVVDQIYISGAYADLNIKMVGSDPGITAAYNGGTHMPIEDLGILRTIPNITILEPVDSVMLEDLLRQIKDEYGMYYIRLSRKVAESIYEEGSTFTIGKAAKLREGTDVTIFATGVSVADSLRAADILEKEGISAAVSNMFTIKPIDKDAIIEAAEKTGAIVTAENHLINNALGSAVSKVLVENTPVPMERIGVRDRFGEVGDMDYLRKTFGMTPMDIANAAKKAISRKK